MTVNSGDIETLKEYLEQQGIGQADLRELEDAIQSESQIEIDKKFGPNMTSWISKIVGKAASGA